MQSAPLLAAALFVLCASDAGAANLPGPHSFFAATTENLHRINIIDGADDRDSILKIGPEIGLSTNEIDRIRKVSGYVGCLSPSPSAGTGALFLNNGQILTVAHIFFERSGKKRWKCFFKNQASDSRKIDLQLDPGSARFGADQPKAGSNDDYAVVRLAEPVDGAEPFPIDESVPVKAGDRLVVVTAHPVGMAKEVDNGISVAQPCQVRRVPKSARDTSFYRSDCDATGSSSGGMHLARVKGRLVFRGITITTGPWEDQSLAGTPYDEARGSVTTALGTGAAILAAGKALAAEDH